MKQEVQVVEKISTAWENIDWNKVLQEGATSLVSGLSASLGKGLGDAFVNAVLGINSSQEAFQREVIDRLINIDKKLTEIIDFLHKELPQVIRKEVEQALVTQRVYEMNARLTTVKGLLAVVRGNPNSPSDSDLMLLTTAANNCLEAGEQLLRNGEAWHLAGMHSFAGGLAGYAEIIKHKPYMAAALQTYAETYAQICNAWIDASTPNAAPLPAHLSKLTQDLNLGKLVVPYLNKGTTHEFLVSWMQSGPDENGIYQIYGCGGWWGIYEDGNLRGDDLYRSISRSTPFDPNSELSIFGFPIPEWWQPAQTNNPTAEYEKFSSLLHYAHNAYNTNEGKIAVLEENIRAIRDFSNACYTISNANRGHLNLAGVI